MENNENGSVLSLVFALIFFLLVILGFKYYDDNGFKDNYWEIRIIHTSDGIEIKHYNYNDLKEEYDRLSDDLQ